MKLDDIVALIVGTDEQDVKETLLPALQKSEQGSASTGGKGKGKDSTQDDGSSSSNATGPPPSNSVLAGLLAGDQDPLDMLRPEEKTIGYLYILNARISAPNPDLTKLMPKVYDWSRNYQPTQARIVTDQVTNLLGRLAHIAQAIENYQVYLEPFKLILQRWATVGTLTMLHPVFLRMVFHYRVFHLAKDLLDVDITHIDKATFPIKYQDHLLYHYLGGTILALQGDYVRACDLLEICVSAPGPAVSMIQLDAYKKLVLIQLLAYGKTLPLPKYTTSVAQNAYKSLLTPYNEYVTAFASLDKTKLAAARERARETLTRDQNLGLVTLVEQSLRRRIIQKLTQTWSTLSLGQLTNLLGMDEKVESQVEAVESEVLGMVQSRDLFATISDPSNSSSSRASKIVTFSDDPEPYLSHETVQRVTAAIERAKRLESAWSDEGDRMEQGKDFVTKVYQTLAAGGGVGLPPTMGGYSDEFDYGSSAGFGSVGRGGGGGAAGGDVEFVDENSDFEEDDMD